MNELFLAKVKRLVPKLRKAQGPWPDASTWTRTFECLINREVPNVAGQVIPSRAMSWAVDPPGLLRHDPDLVIGRVGRGRLRGTDLLCELAVPPAGVDVLVDETVKYVQEALARGAVVPVSMHTKNVFSAGGLVLKAELEEVSIGLTGDRPGIPGCRVLRIYEAAGSPRPGASPEAARLVAAAQAEADAYTAQRWRGGLERDGWRGVR